MNKRVKQLMAVILVVCALLTMVVPAAFAEGKTNSVVYDFELYRNSAFVSAATAYSKITEEGVDRINANFDANGKYDADSTRVYTWFYKNYKTAINWGIETPKGVNSSVKDYYFRGAADQGLRLVINEPGQYASVRIYIPEAGKYKVDLTAGTNVQDINVYIFKASTAYGAKTLTTTDAISKAMGDSSKKVNKNAAIALKANEVSALGEWNFDDQGDYIVVFEALENADNGAGIRKLTLTPVVENNVASVGDKNYTDAASAIDAIEKAGENDTVEITGNLQLTKEEMTTAAAIVVKSGAVLDLNGKALSAASVTSFGDVKDSSVNAEGILKVAANKLSLQSTNSQFALYDSTNNGYKFYTATVTNNLETVKVDDTTSTYWFRITFSADSAYDLIASGNSGLKIEAALNWDGGSKTATPEASFYEGWAPAVKDNPNIAISLTVKGVDQVDNLTVTASITNTAPNAAQ